MRALTRLPHGHEDGDLMRILLLAQFYPPIIGGEERHVKTLANSLLMRGHQVSVVTLGHGKYESVVVEDGVTVYRISGLLQRFPALFSPDGRQHAPPIPDPELMSAIDRIVGKEQPDIVHAHNWMVHSYLPLKRRHRAGLVLTLHDYSLVCAKKSMIHDGAPCDGPQLRKCLLCAAGHYGSLKGSATVVAAHLGRTFVRSQVDRFIAVSDAVAERCGLIGAHDVETIPNFISNATGTRSFDPSVEPFVQQLPEGKFVLFVGDLMQLKGIPTLLAAHEQLASDWPLVLIGRRCADTPDHLPRNVHLFESWPHGAVLEAWRRCTFGVLPSTGMEACATVVMEANAMGKPMIVSRTGGLPEIVDDGSSGILVPPGDAGALAEAMRQLMCDHTLRQRLSEASVRKAQSLMADAIVPRIERVYRALVSERSGQLTDQAEPSPRISARV